MKRIKLTIMGRQYPIKVEDQDEAMMFDIAQFVEQRIKQFKKELANQPEQLILTLTCLSLAEELFKHKQHTTGSTASPSSSQSPEASANSHRIQRLLTEILSEIRQ